MTTQSNSPRNSAAEASGLRSAASADVSGRLSQRVDLRARPGRLFLPNDPPDLVVASLLESGLIEGRRTGQEFIKQNTQRVDVGPSVHVEAAHLSLLGTHVHRRTHHLPVGGEQRLLGESLVDRLRNTEINDLHDRRAIIQHDQNV